MRRLSDEESIEIFGTAEPTRGDVERAQKRYDAWCRPLKGRQGGEDGDRLLGQVW
jgi:hypothetical protein